MTSSRASGRVQPWILTLPELLELAAVGRVRVPAAPRGSLLWRPAAITALFDSIARGLPVGSLVLARRPGPAGTIRFGPVAVEAPDDPEALWVIDGVQRVISLVGALLPLDEVPPPPFDVLFDPEDGTFHQPLDWFVPGRAVPLRDAFGEGGPQAWWRGHGDAGMHPGVDERIALLERALDEYAIPSYVVDGDDAYVHDVIVRMHTTGTRRRRSNLVAGFPEHAGGSFLLSDVAEALRAVGFGRPSPDLVLTSLRALRGLDLAGPPGDEVGDSEEAARWRERTFVALRRTFAFLSASGVPHEALLPSVVPLPVLAAFFDLHPAPSPWNRRLLARWLWRGWAHGFGLGDGRARAMQRAARSVRPPDGHDAPAEYAAVRALLGSVPAAPAPALESAEVDGDSATGRLVLLALAARHPRRLDGAPIDLPALLDEHRRSAVTHLMPEPADDVATWSFWPLGAPAPPAGAAPEVLESHLISPEVADALRQGRVDEARTARRSAVRQAFAQLLSNRMELRAPVRPPLADLIDAAEGG